MRKSIIVFAVAILFLAGCLDMFRYSESEYEYSITIPRNQSVTCEFTLSQESNVSYKLTSDNALDFRLLDVDVVITDPENGTADVTFTAVKTITPEQNTNTYSEIALLDAGLYNLIIYSDVRTSHITLETDVEMDCR